MASNNIVAHKYFGPDWGPGGIDSAWESIGSVSDGFQVDAAYGPAAVSWGAGRLDLFACGTGGGVYHKYYDSNGGGWGPNGQTGDWEAISTPAVCAFAGAPAAVSWSKGRLDIFAVSTAGVVYHKYYDSNGGGWGPNGQTGDWERLGGPAGVSGSPSVVSWATGRLDIFVLGGDGHIYHQYYDTAWGLAWESLGPPPAAGFVFSPVAIATTAGRLDVFACSADGIVYHKFYGAEANGSNWGPGDISAPWESVGGGSFSGPSTGRPAVTSAAPGRLDIFVCATTLNYHALYGPDGSGWGLDDPWTSILGANGVTYLGSPTAVAWAPERLDVFVLPSSLPYPGSMFHLWMTPTNNGVLEDVGTTPVAKWSFNGSPVVVSWAPDRLDVFSFCSGSPQFLAER